MRQEREVYEYRLKDKYGPDYFAELKDWLTLQVVKYNKHRGRDELLLESSTDANSPIQIDGDRTISIKRRDRSRGPLKISYSPVAHIITYECGAGKGQFNLAIQGGTAVLETPNHIVKTIEEIGEEMLSRFENSPF